MFTIPVGFGRSGQFVLQFSLSIYLFVRNSNITAPKADLCSSYSNIHLKVKNVKITRTLQELKT